MNRKKIIFPILVILLSFPTNPSDNIPFIAPAARIGWSFGRSLTLGFKTSIGMYAESGTTYSIAIGGKTDIGLKKKGTLKYTKHAYCDLLIGQWIHDIHLGGGGGVGFYRKNEGKIGLCPHLSFSGGKLLFSTVDFLFLTNFRNDADLGLAVVLPFPLKKESISFD